MKYLQYFEQTYNKQQPKIGDIVKCIDANDTKLIKDKCYTISNITISKGKTYTYYEFEEHPKPNLKYYKERFTKPTQEDLNKYNLEHSKNKYNL